MKTKCNTNIYTTHCPSTKEVQYNLPTANDHDDTIPNAVGRATSEVENVYFCFITLHLPYPKCRWKFAGDPANFQLLRGNIKCMMWEY